MVLFYVTLCLYRRWLGATPPLNWETTITLIRVKHLARDGNVSIFLRLTEGKVLGVWGCGAGGAGVGGVVRERGDLVGCAICLGKDTS